MIFASGLELLFFPEMAHLRLSAVPGPAAGSWGMTSSKNAVAPKVALRLEGVASPRAGREAF